MAATYGSVRGYKKSGEPQQHNPQTACGHGSMEARAQTYRTFASVTVFADGSGFVEVKQNGNVIHRFAFGSENVNGSEAPRA